MAAPGLCVSMTQTVLCCGVSGAKSAAPLARGPRVPDAGPRPEGEAKRASSPPGALEADALWSFSFFVSATKSSLCPGKAEAKVVVATSERNNILVFPFLSVSPSFCVLVECAHRWVLHVAVRSEGRCCVRAQTSEWTSRYRIACCPEGPHAVSSTSVSLIHWK